MGTDWPVILERPSIVFAMELLSLFSEKHSLFSLPITVLRRIAPVSLSMHISKEGVYFLHSYLTGYHIMSWNESKKLQYQLFSESLPQLEQTL